MQFTTPEAVAQAAAFARIRIPPSVDIVVCPSYTALAGVRAELQTTSVSLGAQDVFWQAHGEYTGEVAAADLRLLGCRYVIIGHSERRRDYGETDEMVNRKVRQALSCKLQPIICLGESLAEKDAALTKKVVAGKLEACLRDLNLHEARKVMVAYEPIWALSTSPENISAEPDSPESAQVVHKYLRTLVAEMFDRNVADEMPIIYGGSVNPANIAGFTGMDDIDGVLVGGASKDPSKLKKIIAAYF